MVSFLLFSPVAFSLVSSVTVSRSIVSNSLQPHDLELTRLLCPWDSPGKNIGVGMPFSCSGDLAAQGLYPALLHCGKILYRLSYNKSNREVFSLLFHASISLWCFL